VRIRPTGRDLAGATEQVDLPPQVAGRIRTMSRAERVTPYMTLLGAYATLLYRYAGDPDVLIGCSVSGRTRPELSSMLGMLVNMVALRVSLAGRPSFRDLLGQVRERVTEALAHQGVPFDVLVQELRPGLPRNRPPLVQVGFNMPYQDNNAILSPLALPITAQGSQLDLTVHVVPIRGGGLRVQMEYAAALFEAETVRRMLADYVRLLDVLTAQPAAEVRRVPLATAPEMAATGGEPSARVLSELIADRAAAAPQACAVVDGEHMLSYGQLQADADALARRLLRAGVQAETPVGIYLRRGAATVTALLAVWRAGGCYLPLDPDHPKARTASILADAGVSVAVAASADHEQLARLGVAVLGVHDAGSAGEAEPGRDGVPLPTPAGSQAAYVLYTSGSTGRPKGVVITHAGIANRVCWPVRRLGLTAADRVLQKTSLTFDAAGWEIFSPLVAGGTVVIAPQGAERDPEVMLRAVADGEISILQVVPSVLRSLVTTPGWADCRALRMLFCAGEPLTGELCRRVRELAPASLAIHNTYGPTECSIDITSYRWPAELTAGPVPIGEPIDGMHAVVLDPDGNVAPAGVPGELYAGGTGLGRGYLNRPDLTAERFVPDPWGPPGARGYRTGDIVRRRPDGVLEFLGRHDDQVKINGVRVEPAEVERALAEHPAVTAAAVLPVPAGDGVRLVGYVVADPSRATAELREHVLQRLPAPHVPTSYVRLEAMPLTTSGKIDRVALRGYAAEDSQVGYVAPDGSAECLVAEVWRELLGVERVGAEDDFFALGGHSLQMGLLASRLRDRLGADIPIARLYTAVTVRAQARLAGNAGRSPAAAPIVPVRHTGTPLPVSAGQRRMWFLEQLDPGRPEHAVPVVAAVPADARPDDVAAAIEIVTSRHEVLRTRYAMHGGEPVQVVGPPFRPRLSAMNAGEHDMYHTVGRVIVELSAEPFDLATGPVLRGRLVRSATEQLLVLLVHHIAWDGGSLRVLLAELGQAYAAVTGTGPAPAAPPVVQYADYAAWQARQPRARPAICGTGATSLPGPVSPNCLPTVRARRYGAAAARPSPSPSMPRRLPRCAHSAGAAARRHS
jgi:amino acid adenylation domain-containing protein